MSVGAVVDGRVDADSPHGGSITVAVAVIVLTSVTAGPHIDVTPTIAPLEVVVVVERLRQWVRVTQE